MQNEIQRSFTDKIQQTSKFGQHFVDENHEIKNIDQCLYILHHVGKRNMSNTLEQLEIYNATKDYPHDILNEKLKYITNVLFDGLQGIRTRPADMDQLN